MQTLIVALLVTGCAIYAAWTLMPAAARRAVALALLKLPLPDGVAAKMRRAATASSGCGCDGCDRAPKKAPPGSPADRGASQPQIVTFHPRPKR